MNLVQISSPQARTCMPKRTQPAEECFCQACALLSASFSHMARRSLDNETKEMKMKRGSPPGNTARVASLSRPDSRHVSPTADSGFSPEGTMGSRVSMEDMG